MIPDNITDNPPLTCSYWRRKDRSARLRPAAGRLLLNASLEAVGGYSGWIAGTGLIIDLAPGRSASIPVIYGTASTREDLGYAGPPGSYWLQVQMRFRRGLDGPPVNTLTAPLTQITVIPRARPLRGTSA